ncbi:MAG: GDSL-type esterase/lipase family protein [Oscillospiraceae bacterium]
MKNVFKSGSDSQNDLSFTKTYDDKTQQLDFNSDPAARRQGNAPNSWHELSEAPSLDEFYNPFDEPAAGEPDSDALEGDELFEQGYESSYERENPEGRRKRTEKSERQERPQKGKKKKTKLQILVNKIKKWLRASNANKAIAIAAAVVLVATLILGIFLIVSAVSGGKDDSKLPGKVDANEVDDAIEENYTFVDENEYSGTLLAKSKDAGDEYIKDTLFIGDSNFARMVMYGYLGYENVIGVESMGIQGVAGSNSVYFSGYSEPVTVVKAVSLMKPRRIVICFGTNNVLSNDPSGFTEAYKSALKSIEGAYEYSDIIICAIPPVGQNRSNKDLKQEYIDSYNLALIKMAKELGYSFLDTSEVLKGQDGYIKPEYVYTDGIHISQKGFDMFFKYVRTHSHIVDDARPQPIGKIPTQVAPPKKEVEEGTKFDPALVTKGATAQFVAAGCKSGAGTTTPSTWAFTVPFDAEAGTEANWGTSLYTAYLAQKGAVVAGSSVVISFSQNSAEFVFTVSVYPVPTCATHTWEDTGMKTAATCASVGKKEQKCKVCGLKQTIDDPAVPKLEHKFSEWKQTTAPTCGAKGVESRKCSVCSTVETREGAAATGQHTWENTKTNPPTCAAGGTITQTCKVCKQTQTIKDTANPNPLAHDWQNTSTNPPTCTQGGTIVQTCSKCKQTQTVSDASKPALGHQWGPETTLPDGTKQHTCTVCNTTETTAPPTPPPPAPPAP